jgi:GNAT superfamily N-acetyltransferase
MTSHAWLPRPSACGTVTWMTSLFTLRAVTPAETRPLRQRILRPHQRVEDLVYPHDDAPATLHVGAFACETMVGTATIHPEAMPDGDGDAAHQWRLRGMATTPEMRRRGIGTALVCACVGHVVARGGYSVWCNARVTAAPFYVALGFSPIGPEFELKDIGPHYLMMRSV